jgi:hypothetical protein
LQALKAPKPEPEKTPALKRPAEARDAREVAKKLLKSGAISAIPKPSEKTETTGFKRSRGLERKLSSSDRAPSGFQPFSSSQGSMVSNEEHVTHEARTKSKVTATLSNPNNCVQTFSFLLRFPISMKISFLQENQMLNQLQLVQQTPKKHLPLLPFLQ